jgi:Helix-turn-helix domain
MSNIAERPAFSNRPEDEGYVRRKWIFYTEVCVPDARLNGADLRVLAILIEAYNFDEGCAFAGRAHMADRTGLHVDTVRNSLRKLCRLKLITRKKGKRRHLYGKTFRATSDYVVWGLHVTGDISPPNRKKPNDFNGGDRPAREKTAKSHHKTHNDYNNLTEVGGAY